MISFDLDTPELAAAYDIVGQRQLSHGKMLIADLAIRPDEQVLDLGAGTGLLAAHVAGIVRGQGRVVAVDPLPLRVELARRKVPSGMEVYLGRAEDLSFLQSDTFDVVYLNSVIHWISDKPRALAEVRRVLKPGGRLGIATAAKEKPHDLDLARERALKQCGLLLRKETALGSPSKVSGDELRDLLATGTYHLKQLVLRTIVDCQPSAAAIFETSEASSFGNHLSWLSADERRRVQSALALQLEAYRTPSGFRLERHLIFAVATKLALF